MAGVCYLHNHSAIFLNHCFLDNLCKRTFRAFDVDTRLYERNPRNRCVVVKDKDIIDARKCREHDRALMLTYKGALRPFIALYRCVRIYPDDEDIAQSSRRREGMDVTDMEKVERTVRRHDALALCTEACAKGRKVVFFHDLSRKGVKG